MSLNSSFFSSCLIPKTKKVCQVQSETTHFGVYFPIYSYYYVPFPFYGPGLGMYYPGLIINTPRECDNCLNKITPKTNKIFKIRRHLYLNQICRRTNKQHHHHNLKVILIHQSQQILPSNHHHLKIHLRQDLLNHQEVVVAGEEVAVAGEAAERTDKPY